MTIQSGSKVVSVGETLSVIIQLKVIDLYKVMFTVKSSTVILKSDHTKWFQGLCLSVKP